MPMFVVEPAHRKKADRVLIMDEDADPQQVRAVCSVHAVGF